MTPRAEALRIVLASASPRRAELLRMLGLEFEVVRPTVDESHLPGEAPAAYVERLAREKASVVAALDPDAWVVAGDTTVFLDGRVLQQPRDESEARAMLQALSGREHEVLTGVALSGPGPETSSTVERTVVHFATLNPGQIEEYVRTGEPMDKAGAYGIQGRGAVLVERVDGDYFNVVGLPVRALLGLFEAAGLRYAFDRFERVAIG